MVDGAGLLLGRHAWLLVLCGVVGLNVCALGMLGRAGVLRVHGLLLLRVLRVGVLVVDGWLARYVGRLGYCCMGTLEGVIKMILRDCDISLKIRGAQCLRRCSHRYICESSIEAP